MIFMIKQNQIELELLVDDVIRQVRNQQRQKGFETYKQHLADCPTNAYDWQNMALQELTDAVNYLAKENIKLRNKINHLEEKLHYLRKMYK